MNIKLFSILFFICNFYCFSQNSIAELNNSAMELYKENPNKAIGILQKALSKSEAEDHLIEIARTKNNLGIVNKDLGKFEKAKALSNEALQVKDSLILASAYNNIGACNRQLGLYETALTNYIKALVIYEAKNDLIQQATVNNNIGMVYSYSGINDKAIEYHLKAKIVFETLENKKGISCI